MATRVKMEAARAGLQQGSGSRPQSEQRRLLERQVAIVTGGARGIGRAIAEELARHGADIAVVDAGDAATTVEAVGALGRTALAFKADVASFPDAQAITAEVIGRLGAVGILVNNAGVSQPKSILELTEAEWDRTVAVNLKSSFNWCKAVAQPMLQRGRGRIVVVSSMSAKHGGGTGAGAVSKACYAATKAGLLGLTRGLAKELAPAVTVNAICPGVIETAMAAALLSGPAASKLRESIPLRRFGRPEDVAHAVLFLASPWADYMTGEVMDVNGGIYID
jgi:3-oxoacyl-[acyl-carrier protein] reductase